MPGTNTISFHYKSQTDFLKIKYQVTVPLLAYTAKRNDEYGYNNVEYKSARAIVADKVKGNFIPAAINQQVIMGMAGGTYAS